MKIDAKKLSEKIDAIPENVICKEGKKAIKDIFSECFDVKFDESLKEYHIYCLGEHTNEYRLAQGDKIDGICIGLNFKANCVTHIGSFQEIVDFYVKAKKLLTKYDASISSSEIITTLTRMLS